MIHVTAIPERLGKTGAMDNRLSSGEASPRSRRASCAVCWQEFQEHSELDRHIRAHHPGRLLDQEELVARPGSCGLPAAEAGVGLLASND